MLWVSYGKIAKEGIQGLVAKPQNRAESVGKLLMALGGKMISYHLLLNGPIDFIIVADIPDDKIADVRLHPQSGWPRVAPSKGALDHQFAKIGKILPPP